MKRILQGLGWLAYWGGWPAFWIYLRLGHGRTRVVVWHDHKVLVVRQWIGDGRWQLPGGGMHKRELPTPAALRELYEETGIQLTEAQLTFVGEAVHRTRGSTFDMHIFSTQVDNTDVKLQHHELVDYAWLPPDQLTVRNTHSDALTAVQMVALPQSVVK
ncbi:MAG TPA: NUDIX domain-containing protein [Candidatus Saccharimonadales bacterium]|nr:NUDIX domain-containing protein [Candidatus Saccharimonadales bacterium]